MTQNNKPLNQGPFLGVPGGPITTEEPDGVTRDGNNSLRDTKERPWNWNPDWPRHQTSDPPKGTT